MKLTGKSAVVTGGGDGIGRSIALTLAREGASVAIPDINKESAERVAQEITERGGRALGIETDVASKVSVDAMSQQVLESFDLKKEISVFSRCPECNQTLKFLSRSEARNLAPLHVLETASRFSLCPGCSRVFWKGSHQKRMQSMIEQILGKEYNEYP